MSSPFNKRDTEDLKARGVSPEQAAFQLKMLSGASPFVDLQRPCTVGDEIEVFSKGDLERLAEVCSRASLSGRIMKFVPASGAASRMFQSLLSIKSRLGEMGETFVSMESPGGDPAVEALRRLISGIGKFAFHDDLKSAALQHGMELEDLLAKGRYDEILDCLLSEGGLNYGNLPKAMVKFHRYPGHCRSAFEEHLVEAAEYVKDNQGLSRVHFTVSPEHEDIVKGHWDEIIGRNQGKNLKWQVTFSTQRSSTDTLSVDLRNQPLRDKDGRLIFRPGGHGALLGNLNDLRGEIIFIKNIDNVAPDHLKREGTIYKKALGGYLVELQQEAFGYLERISRRRVRESLLKEVFEFARARLSVVAPKAVEEGSEDEKVRFLSAKLNRPMRVCGMVRSEGEPGGGPFWIKRGGDVSSQIVESSQVDFQSMAQRALWESSTHFNPVDLVCGVRNFRGVPFDLEKFVDQTACFVSIKSAAGQQLKALELPGLWNGAMADWTTVFVEVPIVTFNPVKTVFDLLRKEHQPG